WPFRFLSETECARRSLHLPSVWPLPHWRRRPSSLPILPQLSLARHRHSSWCATAVDAVGIRTVGATNRAIGTGATVSRTGVPTTFGLQVGAIPTQIGARNRLGEVGVTNRIERRVLSRWPTILSGAL